jgi:dTDP-glucose pyrophosphorylase
LSAGDSPAARSSGRALSGVILAAGKGSRMAAFSSRYPKPMLPVLNKPVLVYQIEQLRSLGVQEIYIVIGHLGYEITRELGDGSSFGVQIHYVEQEEVLGIAHAVARLEKVIKNRFLLFLGDIFFVTGDLGKMIEEMDASGAEAMLAVKDEPDRAAIQRNFTVTLDEEGNARRVIEKPRHAKTRMKGCGIYLFDLPIFDAIRRTPRTAMRDEYEITDSIQILIDDGYRVRVSEVIHDDINLTFATDLLDCNLAQLRRLELDKVVGQIKGPVRPAAMQNCVIGDDVTFENPIEVHNSVIFPGTRLLANVHLDRVIVTPEVLIDCRGDHSKIVATKGS